MVRVRKRTLTHEESEPYDNGLKRLLEICAQESLNWLLPGALYTGRRSEAFQSFSIDADKMHETSWDGKPVIAHFEFQSGPDANMVQRLLEYFVLAYRRYSCALISTVISPQRRNTTHLTTNYHNTEW